MMSGFFWTIKKKMLDIMLYLSLIKIVCNKFTIGAHLGARGFDSQSGIIFNGLDLYVNSEKLTKNDC